MSLYGLRLRFRFEFDRGAACPRRIRIPECPHLTPWNRSEPQVRRRRRDRAARRPGRARARGRRPGGGPALRPDRVRRRRVGGVRRGRPRPVAAGVGELLIPVSPARPRRGLPVRRPRCGPDARHRRSARRGVRRAVHLGRAGRLLRGPAGRPPVEVPELRELAAGLPGDVPPLRDPTRVRPSAARIARSWPGGEGECDEFFARLRTGSGHDGPGIVRFPAPVTRGHTRGRPHKLTPTSAPHVSHVQPPQNVCIALRGFRNRGSSAEQRGHRRRGRRKLIASSNRIMGRMNGRNSSTLTASSYSFPSTRSTTQHPRTCDPGPRQWSSTSAFSHPASCRASARTGRFPNSRASHIVWASATADSVRHSGRNVAW